MTRANSLQPPRLATWLLEQFSPILQNAPLAGDLMEAFKHGRSSSWYWRQVFGAILIALPNLLRKQWGCFAYAVGWSGLISAAWFFMSPAAGHGSALPQVFALYAKGYAIQWPWSLVYQIAFLTAFQFVIVAVALGAYLSFSRILNPQNLLRALMVVVIVLASSNVALTFLIDILSAMRLGLLFGWVLVFAPPIVALLLGMWRANLDRTSRPIST
jgi:hypothetical protein